MTRKGGEGPSLIFIPFPYHFWFSSAPFTISLLFLSVFPFFLASCFPFLLFFPTPSLFPPFPQSALPKFLHKLSKGGRLDRPPLIHTTDSGASKYVVILQRSIVFNMVLYCFHGSFGLILMHSIGIGNIYLYSIAAKCKVTF